MISTWTYKNNVFAFITEEQLPEIVDLLHDPEVERYLWFAPITLEGFRTYTMPLMFTLPWGVVLGPVPAWPIPTKVTLKVLEPMRWEHLGPEDAEDPQVLERCYDGITQRMQSALDDLAKEYPYPIVARLQSLLR